MRQIEDTPMGKEILKITSNKNSGINYVKHKLILHTKEHDIPIKLIESVEILRDFNSNTSDYIVASFIIGMGDYIKDIYPYRDNLNLTIIKIFNNKRIRYNYKFIMLNNQAGVNGSMYSNSSRDELNKNQQVRIIGQCVDRVSEALRMSFPSGIYHNMSLDDMLHSIYLTNIRQVNSMLGGVNLNLNLAPLDNQKIYNHIKIPTGINIMNVATYLQEREYGLYNGGVGTYYLSHDNKHTVDGVDRYPSVNNLYIYPLYNNTRFDKVKKNLIIYGVSSAKFDLVEHTYMLDGDVLSIVAGLSTNSIDDGGNNQLQNGVGFSNLDANKILERNAEVKDSKVIVDKNTLNQGETDINRRDQNNLARHIGSASNMYPYRTQVIKDSMMIYQIQWNYCDPNLIYPGMPVMFIYMDSMYGLVKLKGTVQSMYILYNEGTNAPNSLINIMVERPYYKVDNTISKSSLYNKKA